MKLSKKQKDELSAHYQEGELYDPSTAPEQSIPEFTPKKMACGGEVKGYAQGGEIDLSTPSLSLNDPFSVSQGASDTAKGFKEPGVDTSSLTFHPTAQELAPGGLKDALVNRIVPPVKQPTMPQAASAAVSPAPAQAPSGSKLTEAEYQDLVGNLKPGMGEYAMQGLGGLADSIMSGVAKAGSPGFQRNIMESGQNKRQNLINALKTKYEAQSRDTQIGLEAERAKQQTRRDQAMEDIARHGQESTIAERAAEREKEKRQEVLKAGEELATSHKSLLNPLSWIDNKDQAAQKARLRSIVDGGGPSAAAPVVVHTQQDWEALPAGTHYTDASGKQGVKR